MIRQRTIDVDGGVRLECLLRGGRVEVQRDRLAALPVLAFGQGDTVEAVPAVGVGLEDYAAVEQRRDRVFGCRRRVIEQLQRAAPLLLPAGVADRKSTRLNSSHYSASRM